MILIIVLRHDVAGCGSAPEAFKENLGTLEGYLIRLYVCVCLDILGTCDYHVNIVLVAIEAFTVTCLMRIGS